MAAKSKSKAPPRELEKLTTEQKLELRRIFSHMDKDKDGYIKIRELSSITMHSGDNMEYNEELVTEGDEDDDVAITVDEFIEIMEEKLNLNDTEDDILEAFRVFDKEGNGFLNCTELRRVMTNLGTRLTDTQVDQMIQESDLDGDGQINYEEFVRVVFTKADEQLGY